MNSIKKATIVALAHVVALGAVPAGAVTIANPTNNYSFPSLSGSLTGGNQTQYIGQTFTAPIAGQLTNFQFTLNSSSLQSLYGVVYAWNGTSPTTELWRSSTIAGTVGLLNFNPTGVNLVQGQTYVAFLSTFGLTSNSGLASVGACLNFGGCNANTIPNLGTLVFGNILGGSPVFSSVVNNSQDATFSATITAPVPESATWAMMTLGMGMVGFAMRRRAAVGKVSFSL